MSSADVNTFWPAISHMSFKVKRMFYTSKWTGECSERTYKVRVTIGLGRVPKDPIEQI